MSPTRTPMDNADQTGRPPNPDAAPAPEPANPQPKTYLLRLFIAGATPQSMRAVANIKNFCETHLEENYTLEVIDLYQQPHLAAGQGIVALPTLVKELPPPLRRLIGDMSDKERILVGLELLPES